jgi:hypothetical protein
MRRRIGRGFGGQGAHSRVMVSSRLSSTRATVTQASRRGGGVVGAGCCDESRASSASRSRSAALRGADDAELEREVERAASAAGGGLALDAGGEAAGELVELRSLSRVRAWSGVLERSRRVQALKPSAASKHRERGVRAWRARSGCRDRAGSGRRRCWASIRAGPDRGSSRRRAAAGTPADRPSFGERAGRWRRGRHRAPSRRRAAGGSGGRGGG